MVQFENNLARFGRSVFALAWLVDFVATQQTLKFPNGATPTNFQGFLTNPPGLGQLVSF